MLCLICTYSGLTVLESRDSHCREQNDFFSQFPCRLDGSFGRGVEASRSRVLSSTIGTGRLSISVLWIVVSAAAAVVVVVVVVVEAGDGGVVGSLAKAPGTPYVLDSGPRTAGGGGGGGVGDFVPHNVSHLYFFTVQCWAVVSLRFCRRLTLSGVSTYDENTPWWNMVKTESPSSSSSPFWPVSVSTTLSLTHRCFNFIWDWKRLLNVWQWLTVLISREDPVTLSHWRFWEQQVSVRILPE